MNNEPKALVVNLFGAPGCGKSTLAAAVFTHFKTRGLDCELVPEYAKELVWANDIERLKDQHHVLSVQASRVDGPAKLVQLVIVDSPILHSPIYASMEQKFDNLLTAYEAHRRYINLNFLVRRSADLKYDNVGRIHTEEQSANIHHQIKHMLDCLHIDYIKVKNAKNSKACRKVIKQITEYLFKWEEESS